MRYDLLRLKQWTPWVRWSTAAPNAQHTGLSNALWVRCTRWPSGSTANAYALLTLTRAWGLKGVSYSKLKNYALREFRELWDSGNTITVWLVGPQQAVRVTSWSGVSLSRCWQAHPAEKDFAIKLLWGQTPQSPRRALSLLWVLKVLWEFKWQCQQVLQQQCG